MKMKKKKPIVKKYSIEEKLIFVVLSCMLLEHLRFHPSERMNLFRQRLRGGPLKLPAALTFRSSAHMR